MKRRYMFMAVAGVFLYLGAAASVSASAADKEADETLPEHHTDCGITEGRSAVSAR